jgi:hypothetical protein
MIKSAERDGNKEIADFNLQKSAAIFANELRECKDFRMGRGGKASGGGKPHMH